MLITTGQTICYKALAKVAKKFNSHTMKEIVLVREEAA